MMAPKKQTQQAYISIVYDIMSLEIYVSIDGGLFCIETSSLLKLSELEDSLTPSHNVGVGIGGYK